MKQLPTPTVSIAGWSRLARLAGLWVASLAIPTVAIAQEAVELPSYSAEQGASGWARPSVGALDFIDVKSGNGQRPRASLRLRADGATKAMRSLGVDAEDCRTVVRSNTHRGGPSESRRLGVSVALNCRFF